MPYSKLDNSRFLNNHRCCVCHDHIEDFCPWSICYDPEVKRNIWGGDTHEYKGYFCQSCAQKILSPSLPRRITY